MCSLSLQCPSPSCLHAPHPRADLASLAPTLWRWLLSGVSPNCSTCPFPGGSGTPHGSTQAGAGLGPGWLPQGQTSHSRMSNFSSPRPLTLAAAAACASVNGAGTAQDHYALWGCTTRISSGGSDLTTHNNPLPSPPLP